MKNTWSATGWKLENGLLKVPYGKQHFGQQA